MSTPFADDFDDDLDERSWLPHYLPHWSSRAESAASFSVDDGALRLDVPRDHGLWCADTHETPIRVSGIQSGCFSGPVGSTTGQQPFAPGLVVREENPLWLGWTWQGGRLEVRARMELSPASMASVWMVGVEDAPERCGEICLFEVFGDALGPLDAAVGQGVHPFRDPALTEDFGAVRHVLDVGAWHTYAADWRSDRIDFSIDGVATRTVAQSPSYPVQMMIAVFDFPDRRAADDRHVPWLQVDRVSAG